MAVEQIGIGDRLQKPLGENHGILGARQPALDDREFVGVEAGQRIFLAQRRAQTLGDPSQQLVADAVAQRVVDGLEVVETEHQHMDEILLHTRRSAEKVAVLMVGLDNFKAVNDTLGHAAGDQLLVDVALRIRAALRAGDTAARVGGDEFAVLLDEVATREAALVIAHRLSEALRAPYEIGTERRIAMASIGVVVGPESFETADVVVAAADAAMYDAKRRGRGRCVLYSKDRNGQARFLTPGDDVRADPGESRREALPG